MIGPEMRQYVNIFSEEQEVRHEKGRGDSEAL